jgi:hypothetical protein
MATTTCNWARWKCRVFSPQAFLSAWANNTPWAIECKASHQVGRSDLRGLASFAEHIKRKHRAVIAYLGSVPRIVDSVEVLPWQTLLAELDAAIV